MSLAEHLPLDATLAAYVQQAEALRGGHRHRSPIALQLLRHCLPRFLDPAVPWKPLPISDDEIFATPLTPDDAQLAVARGYSFLDWQRLVELVAAVHTPDSPVGAFERAVEAVITGDADALRAMLAAQPELIRARSTRVTCHDPAVHGATLLHYIGANGVESYRQRTPSNAVEIARLLFDAGAEPDALAHMYGGPHATLGMLISSSKPREAGVHLDLLQLFLERGAAPDGASEGAWSTPLFAALVFGYRDAAALVAARGARADTLPFAAGLGRLADSARLLPLASEADRHAALAMAVINEQLDVTALLLDAGVDPNRFNPPSMHAHSTPLHGAALGGHLALVQLLVRHGARVDLPDRHWHSTAADWAEHGEHPEVAAWLRAQVV